MKINIKPLSVNECYQGRRFKNKAYKAYERELMYKIPKQVIPKGKLKVSLMFGFSSKLSDVDNPVKNFIDVLQKRLGFNDRDIYEMTLKKEIVPKGKEFIEYEIKAL